MGPAPTRPILALRRAETARPVRRAGLAPVDDPSNDDPRFRRNRVRHELLPLMDDVAERDIVPMLVRTADVLADDDDAARLSSAADLDPTDARALAAAAGRSPAGRPALAEALDGAATRRTRRPSTRVLGSPAASAGRARSPAAAGSNGTGSGCASSPPGALVSPAV